MQKKLIPLSLLIILLGLVALIIYLLKSGSKNEPTITSHTMVVQQIEEMGKLEVVKYNIQDMMEYEKVRQWLPNSKATLKIVGEVIACVDLTIVGENDIVTSGDSISLMLPLPEICHYKIDHSRSRVYNMEYGLWESAEIVEDAYKNAEQQIYQQAQNMGIEKESRENTIKVLTPIFRAMGFTKIYIGFKSPAGKSNSDQPPINFH
uniref:DUF4230 domain-containing protein n=1 Tax=uncultured Dysgonomonas sp. TaxID=206096 RepID=UPI0026312686|nr:DUF4230 domain-containing protein [uncultured Dysgonomonas sp.]